MIYCLSGSLSNSLLAQMEQLFHQKSLHGVIVLNYWTYLAERVFVYQFLFYACDRVGKGAMGEPQMKFVQLTQAVAYYLEHMEVLFLRGARHRFVVTFLCLQIYALMFHGTVFICSCNYEASILQTRKSVGVTHTHIRHQHSSDTLLCVSNVSQFFYLF